MTTDLKQTAGRATSENNRNRDRRKFFLAASELSMSPEEYDRALHAYLKAILPPGSPCTCTHCLLRRAA
jgi:hypothetical protein